MTQITLLPNINSPMKYHCPGIISRMFTVTNEVQKDQAFPPVHQYTPNESERRSVMSDFLRPHGLYSRQNSPSQNTGVGGLFPGNLPNSGIELRSPALQADSLPAEPQGCLCISVACKAHTYPRAFALAFFLSLKWSSQTLLPSDVFLSLSSQLSLPQGGPP